MKVYVNKRYELQPDAVQQILTEFGEWLDDQGLLSKAVEDIPHRDLADKFIAHRRTIVAD